MTAVPGRDADRAAQQTFAEIEAAEAAMSRDFDVLPDTAATSESSDVVSAAACAVAAFTAAPISAADGEAPAGCDDASFETAAAAERSAAICDRRVAAAGRTFAPAVEALAEPQRASVSPEATREQLRVAIGYAPARTALSPLRADVVPSMDDDLSASSVVLDFSTRDLAANVLSAAASDGLVVGTAADVAEVVVELEDVVVDELEEVEDVVVGESVPSPEAHPARRQTASAVVTSVLRRMAGTPHHVVGRAPLTYSHPGPSIGADSGDTEPDWTNASATPYEGSESPVKAINPVPRELGPATVSPVGGGSFAAPSTPRGERGPMNPRRAAARVLSPLRGALPRRSGMVPGYLVVGTKRGGSTSIAHYINQHPEVAPCRSSKGTHYFDVNHGRGWSWYLSCFPPARDGQRLTGEASPYYMFHPLAPERIARELPDVRIVVSLREPVARAWSHHQYETQQGYEDQPFEQALRLEDERLAGEEERLRRNPSYESFSHRHHAYLRRGHYAEQLERLYELFDPEQVLVLRSESMFTDPHGELDRVWAHLGLTPVTLDGLDRLKPTHSPLAIADDLARELYHHYRPWNDRLAQLPGVGFTWSDTTTRGDS
jgi:hypothetical protein